MHFEHPLPSRPAPESSKELKIDWCMRALWFLLEKELDEMSVHDDMKAAAQQTADAQKDNADKVAAISSKRAQLVSLLGSTASTGDAANQDVLKLLQDNLATEKSTGTALDTESKALDDAISAAGSNSKDSTMGAAGSVTVSDPTSAGAVTIPISADTAPAVGSTVAGPGVAAGATVLPGTTASTLILSKPTTDDHKGDETLTVTPPATDAAAAPTTPMGTDATGYTLGSATSSGPVSASQQVTGSDLGPNPSADVAQMFSAAGVKKLADGNGG